MRPILPILLLATAAAQAQDRAAPCNAVTGPADINDRGEFAVPPPTVEECDAVAALVERFLTTPPHEFRQIVSPGGIPGNVRVYIGPIAPWGGPWNDVGRLGSSIPGKRHVVTWVSASMVVVVYESGDFTGFVTNVLITDRDNLKVCEYPRWPFDDDPRKLDIEDIQAAIESGRVGEREVPACHLKPLVID